MELTRGQVRKLSVAADWIATLSVSLRLERPSWACREGWFLDEWGSVRLHQECHRMPGVWVPGDPLGAAWRLNGGIASSPMLIPDPVSVWMALHGTSLRCSQGTADLVSQASNDFVDELTELPARVRSVLVETLVGPTPATSFTSSSS